MATRKRRPWNAGGGLRFPSLEGDEHPKPAPIEGVSVGHSTTVHGELESWECLRCERLRAGRDPLVPDHHRRCPYRDTGRDPEREG